MTSPIDTDLLQKSPLGKDLDPVECQALAEIMGQRHLKKGDTLIEEGGQSSTLFILVSGKLEVMSLARGTEQLVYTMTPEEGGVAGTRAFVDGSPRKATIKASSDAVVYTLEPAPFEALLGSYPRVVYKVMRELFCITHSNLMRMNAHSQQLEGYIHRSGGRN